MQMQIPKSHRKSLGERKNDNRTSSNHVVINWYNGGMYAHMKEKPCSMYKCERYFIVQVVSYSKQKKIISWFHKSKKSGIIVVSNPFVVRQSRVSRGKAMSSYCAPPSIIQLARGVPSSCRPSSRCCTAPSSKSCVSIVPKVVVLCIRSRLLINPPIGLE